MPLINSYVPDYFSIDDILATQERTPCQFLKNVPKMGCLNPSAEQQDIKAGLSLDLPLWLVTEIGLKLKIVAPEFPKIYREAYREILKADASAVDLHKFNLYFYELGLYVRDFDATGDVQNILVHTFKTRFRQLMDLADNTVSDPTVQYKLDLFERKLFKDGHNARIKLNAWLLESGSTIEAANMVTNHKKRKRVQIEDLL